MARGENSPCFQFIHKTLGEGLIGVEIGIWDGGNAEAVLTYIHPKKYYMIDPYRVFPGNPTTQPEYDSMYLRILDKFSTYNNAIIMRKTSEYASICVGDNLDFVYIDGAHDLVNKTLDLTLWYPKIRSGGIICGDDHNLPTVQQAVETFSKSTGLKFEFSSNCDPHPPEFWAIKE